MKNINLGLLVTIIAFFSEALYAIPFTFEARSLGMGGVSVATADIATAAWANPAMLTNQRPEDDFSLLIGLGAFVRDNDDLITDIDNFQQADSRRKAAIVSGDIIGEAGAILDMSLIVGGTESKVIAPEVTGVAAFGIAFESFAMAISIRADAIAGGAVTDFACDITDPGCDPNELFSDQFNILNVEGVLATEIGISFAKVFQLFNRKVSIGIKPKIVDLQGFSLRQSILTVDVGLDTVTDKKNKTSIGTFSTVDLGMVIDISESVRLGLNLRNLIANDFVLGGQTLNFDTEARIGVSYRNQFVTIAADYDLLENVPLLANKSFAGLKTQYLALGAEVNVYDYVKLRIGALKNLAGGISGGADNVQYTAGVGLWLGFNLDAAVIIADNSIGGFLQTGFRF